METARAHRFFPHPAQARPQARLSPLLVLANSYKQGKRCVAGLDWSGGVAGGWIRPVCGDGDASGIDQPQLAGGTKLLPGDIVGAPLADAVPVFHQTENRLLLPGRTWRRLGRLRWHELADLADEPVYPLWADGVHPGNDRVPASAVQLAEGSLRFIRAHDAVLVFGHRFGNPDKVKAWVLFGYAGRRYRLTVTDPLVLGCGQPGLAEQVAVGDVLVCVSLTQPFHGDCYKLAASILPSPDRYGGNS